MVTVGIRELKQQASELIRRVRESGDEIRVTYHGKVVAHILPISPTLEETGRAWDDSGPPGGGDREALAGRRFRRASRLGRAAMNYVVVDASVWVARLVPQEVFHHAVRAWMEAGRLAGTEFLAPALLLAEVAGAISRRSGDPGLATQAVTTLEHLPGLRLVEMDRPLLDEATHLAAELGLRGADSTYVAVASRLNLPLATLDADQSTRAVQRVSIQPIQ